MLLYMEYFGQYITLFVRYLQEMPSRALHTEDEALYYSTHDAVQPITTYSGIITVPCKNYHAYIVHANLIPNRQRSMDTYR